MKAIYRLKRRSRYAKVYKKGKWQASSRLAVVYCPSPQEGCQVGFSISRKFGNAVQRNRTKRQLKECVSKLLPRMKKRTDYIFVAKEGLTTDFAALSALVTKLLVDADLLTRE